MDSNGKNFEAVYSAKGRGLLDEIFGEFTPERNRVRLAGPRRERQVVFVVDYKDRQQYNNAIESLCNWLKENDHFDNLKSLMLS